MLYFKKIGDYKNSERLALNLMVKLDSLKKSYKYLQLSRDIKDLDEFAYDFKTRYIGSVEKYNTLFKGKVLKKLLILKKKREKRKKIDFLEFFNNYGIPYNKLKLKFKKKVKEILYLFLINYQFYKIV